MSIFDKFTSGFSGAEEQTQKAGIKAAKEVLNRIEIDTKLAEISLKVADKSKTRDGDIELVTIPKLMVEALLRDLSILQRVLTAFRAFQNEHPSS